MHSKTHIRIIQVLNVVFFIAAVTANTLAVVLPLNGKSTQALSDAYPNLFVPSGLTFSIWGVIYIMLALYCLYQTGALNRKGTFNDRAVTGIGVFFIVSSIANFLWIFAWHYEVVWLSMALMLVLLISLMIINIKLAKIKDMSVKEKILVQAPFSIYFGWISVATIANATALLVKYQWNGFGISAEIWTMGVIGVALILTVLQLVLKRDIAYSLVVLWALTGILIRPDIAAGQHNNILVMVITSMVIIAVGIIYAAVRMGISGKHAQKA